VALSLALPSFAEVIATVDRTTVELNESFTLKLTVDSQIDVEPNVSALESDFFVGSRSNMSNTTIINGEVSRTRIWSFVLMAKNAGNLTIPPIAVGSDQSNPVRIMVAPQSTAVPGEADIFITAEVDNTSSYVQAQVLYTVQTYRAVATRQPRWSEPVASGVEALVEVAGEEKNYEAQLNGRAYHVVERTYAFFPQESGELQIAPAQFQARVLVNGRITGRKVFQSEAVAITVNPIPPPPADYPDAAWFPAKAVELRQDWSRELGGVPAGEPITRHVTVHASGQLQTQIPQLQPANVPNIRVYPDKPEERTVAGEGGIRAMRRDQYALIGMQAGDVELPELVLPWWNVDAGEWRLATLPATILTISPSQHAEVAPPPIEEQPIDPPAENVETVVVHSEMWRRISEGLAVLWVITLVTWWWSRRERKAKVAREPQEPPLHKQQARALKSARKAALAGEGGGLKTALLEWARLQWPDDAPRNVGDLAARVSLPLSSELKRLCSASYGPEGRDWDGDAIARALRSFSVIEDENTEVPLDELPPLYPGKAA